MEIDYCSFPDDLLYDVESNTWMRIGADGEVTVGVNSLLSAIAGKLTLARLKPAGSIVLRGRSLGTLESLKFVGPIPSPVSGVVSETNDSVVKKPKLLNDSPYGEGWIARLKPSRLDAERVSLSRPQDSRDVLRSKIAEFRARCFKAFPDHEMYEIGSECSAVLVRLNELVVTIPFGDVVHIVSDDSTAYVEMVRWTEETGQSLLDWRKESNLFHFIVKKLR